MAIKKINEQVAKTICPVTVDKIENEQVFLSNNELGVTTTWPKNKLPDSITIGQTLYAKISTDDNSHEERTQIIREIVTELIN